MPRFEIDVVTRFRTAGVREVSRELSQALREIASAPGLSPAQRQQQVSQAESAARTRVQELSNVGDITPAQAAGRQGVISRLINSLQGDLSKLPAPLQALARELQSLTTQTRGVVQKTGAGTGGGAQVPPTPAETAEVTRTRAQEQQQVQRILATDKEYLDAQAKGLTARRIEERNIRRRMAGDDRYIVANAAVARYQQQIEGRTRDRLAGDSRYIEAMAQTTSGRTRSRAAVQAILAGDSAYVNALAETTRSQQQIKAQQANILAGDNAYLKAKAATTRAQDLERQKLAQLASRPDDLRAHTGRRLAEGVRDTRQDAALAEAQLRRPQDLDARAEANVLKQQVARRVSIQEQILRLDGAIVREVAEEQALKARRNTAERRALAAATTRADLAERAKADVDERRNRVTQDLMEARELARPANQGLLQDEGVLAAQNQTRAAQIKAWTDRELAVNKEYIDATAASANARRQQRDRIRGAQLGMQQGKGEGDVEFGARVRVGEEEQRLRQKIALHRAELGPLAGQVRQANDVLALKTEERRLQSIQNRELARRAREEARAQGPISGGSRFQNMQAWMASRRGDFRDPEEFQKLAQFAGSKALTTAGFAASGAVFYTLTRGAGELLREIQELDVAMVRLQSQFEATGRADQFAGYRDSIMGIARETGIQADQVAGVGIRMAGAYKDSAEAADQTRSAMKIAAVTGLEQKDVMDSLLAASLSYGVSMEDLGDKAIGLEERFGVSATEIIQSYGDMSAVAQQAGLSFEQFGAIIAATAVRSGRPTTAISEGLGRVLPQIQQNAGGILSLYNREKALQPDVGEVQGFFQEGETGQVLLNLASNYDKLSKSGQDWVVTLLGGRREAAHIIPLMQAGADVAKELGTEQHDAGNLSDRFGAQMRTLSGIIKRAGEEMRQIGQELADLGFLDALKAAGGVILLSLSAFGGLVRMLGDLNDALGGLPIRLLAAVAGFRAMVAAGRALSNMRITGAVLDLLRPGRAGTAAGAAQVAGQLALPLGGAGRAGGIRGLLAGLGSYFAGSTGQGFGRGLPRAGPVAMAGDTLLPLGAMPWWQRNAMAAGSLSGRAAGGALTGIGMFGASAAPFMSRIPSFGPMIGRAGVALGGTGVYGSGVGAAALGGTSSVLAGTAGVAGGLATLGVGAAMVASVIWAKNQIDKLIEDQKEAKEISDEAIRGANFLALQDEGDTWGTAGSGFGDLVGSIFGSGDFTESLGAFATGNQTDRERFDEALQTEQVAAVEDAINAGLFDDLSDEQLNDLREKAGDTGEAERIAEMLRRRADDRGMSQQELAQLLNEGASARADAADDGATNAQTAADAQLAFQAGEISYQEMIETLRQETESLAGINDPETRRQYLQMRQQLNQQLSQTALTAQSLAVAMTKLSGGSIDEQIAAATRALRNPDLKLDPAALEQAAMTVVGLQQEGLAQAIATAPSAEEALRRAEEGVALSPAARQAIREANERKGITGQPIPTHARASEQELRQIRAQVIQENIAQLQASEGAYLDPVEQADQAIRIARMQYQGAQNDMERAQAQIAYNQARRQLNEAQDARLRSGMELMAAMSEDPVEQAGWGVRLAQFDVSAAVRSGDEARINQAKAALISARRAERDAIIAIGDARLDLMAAATPQDNAVAQAAIQQQQANRALANAKGEAERLQAMAQQIQANRAMQEAIDAIFDSQISVAQALADANGQVIRSAGLGLQQAQAELSRAMARGAGEAEINELKANVIRAQAGVEDARLQNRRDIIEFNLEMEKISTDQAIQQLTALLEIADPAEQRDILRRIKALRDQASQDLQFNIPDEIKLPTLYEVRRLNQTPAGSSYQDNRVVSVNIAAINNQADMDAALTAIRDAAGGSPAPRTGVRPGLY